MIKSKSASTTKTKKLKSKVRPTKKSQYKQKSAKSTKPKKTKDSDYIILYQKLIELENQVSGIEEKVNSTNSKDHI